MYRFTPTMNLLRQLERNRPEIGERFNLFEVTRNAATGKPQLPVMMKIMEEVMQYAGAKDFTEEHIYQELHYGDQAYVFELWFAIVEAISPAPKESKKAAAPDEK